MQLSEIGRDLAAPPTRKRIEKPVRRQALLEVVTRVLGGSE